MVRLGLFQLSGSLGEEIVSGQLCDDPIQDQRHKQKQTQRKTFQDHSDITHLGHKEYLVPGLDAN